MILLIPSTEELRQAGNIAFKNQEFKKAAKIYRDAIKQDSKNPVLYSNRAQCFLKLEDYGRALRDCQMGIKCNPEEKLVIKLYFRKGMALRELGRTKEAKVAFEKTLSLDPDSCEARRALDKLTEIKPILPIHIETVTAETVSGAFPGGIVLDVRSLSMDKEKSFVDRPTMGYLKGLKNFPHEKKKDAYIHVINVSEIDYKSLFLGSIEPDFLDFFIEAAAYVSENNSVRHWDKVILNHLSLFHEQSSFEEHKFDKDHLAVLLKNVRLKSIPTIVNSYEEIFNDEHKRF